MIVRISPNSNAKILHIDRETGDVFLKVKYYAQFAIAASVVTTEGDTIEDFKQNRARANKQILVGNKGGISVD